MKKSHPVHPSEVLAEKFLKPMGLSRNRLARFFVTSAEFWLGLRSQYDLDIVADELGDRLEQEVREYSRAI